MRSFSLTILACALITFGCFPDSPTSAEPLPSRVGMFVRDAETPTSLPINYESHWYTQSGLMLKYNFPEAYSVWLDKLRKYPPEIYHGEVAPLSWGIGPAEPRPGMPIDYYKFDKKLGHHWLTSEQWEDRIAKTREHLAAMREAGVKEILCYTCFNSIGGNHVKRTGLWEFYDHWDEYKDMLNLPARPHDPTEWLRVWGKHWGPNPKKNLPDALKPFSFAYWPMKELYAPQWRYATCNNTPGWMVWHTLLARWAAKAGYDGFFWDNYVMRRCACRWCTQGFREYLKGKYSLQEIQEVFRVKSVDEIQLDFGSKTMRSPLSDESSRFWFRSSALALQTLERNIRDDAPRWKSAVNWIFTYYTLNALPPVEYFLTEHIFLDEYRTKRVDWGYLPGYYLPRGIPMGHAKKMTPTEPVLVQNIYTYSTRQATRFPGQKHWLIAGTPNIETYHPTPDTVRLALAECAAFGGGAGVDAVLSHYIRHTGKFSRFDADAWLQARQDFFQFIHEHEGLFEGYRSYGKVGIFCPTENRGVSAQCIANSLILDHLLEAGVPTVFLTDNLIHPANLDGLRVLIVHGAKCLSVEEADEFDRFLRRGGVILASGPFGEFDMLWRPRARSAKRFWLPPRPLQHTQDVGKGKLVYNPDGPPDKDRLRKLLTQYLGEEPSALAEPVQNGEGLLRMKAWIKEVAGEQQIVLHLVNYKAPFGAEHPTPVAPIKNIQISLPLTGESVVEKVEAIDPNPGAKFQSLPFKLKNGRLVLTVPEMEIYKLVRVR